MKWIRNKPTAKKYIVQSVVGAAVFAFVLILDLVSKALTDGIHGLVVIPGFISFSSVRNPGGAWSIFGGNDVVMTIIMVFTFVFVAAALFFLYWPDGRKNMFFIVTLALLGSGALGNLVDRLAFGEVRDFLHFEFMNFPTFNVADVALVSGVIMLIVNIIIWFVRSETAARREKKAAEKHDEESGNGDDGGEKK